jgi:hypothetical protein
MVRERLWNSASPAFWALGGAAGLNLGTLRVDNCHTLQYKVLLGCKFCFVANLDFESARRASSMESQSHAPSIPDGNFQSGSFRQSVSDAVRFWEPARLLYNFLLIGIAFFWFVATWPHFRGAMTLIHGLQIALLALIANACYCAAYLVDIGLQRTFSGDLLRRWRWGLWILGTFFAIVLTNYWIADEIYPFVR